MSKLDYAEVKAQTQKDPTDRLLAEGVLGQTARGRDFLEALDREQLVEFVALMRLSLGQKESVKGKIKGYDPDKAKAKIPKSYSNSSPSRYSRNTNGDGKTDDINDETNGDIRKE